MNGRWLELPPRAGEGQLKECGLATYSGLDMREPVMVETTPRRSQKPFQLRIDPQVKAAFGKAAEAERRPPSELVESFMRAFVRRSERRALEARVRRDTREAAALSRSPESDEFKVMEEIEAEFAEVWGEI